MFDLGWSEMGIVLLVALLVLGPKELPRLARDLGRWVGKARSLAREFQRSLEDIARETELDEVKKQIEDAARATPAKRLEKVIDPDGDLADAFDPAAPAKPKAPPGLSEPAKVDPPKVDPPRSETSTDDASTEAVGAAPSGRREPT
ncbi:MAG: Sec-independent protein translocase protein TatB [Pseudomonadota bacterium]